MNLNACIAALLVAGCAVTGGAHLAQEARVMQDGHADPQILPGVHAARDPGEVVSEGARVMGSDHANAAGHTGKGVRVAVIDTGFDVANPEIAGNVAEYKSFYSGSDIAGDNYLHGTAVAEIIADVAPDAELYLYNFGTNVEFFNLVDHIIARGDIDVVSMSLGWYPFLPADGTSRMAQKVSEARDGGILWVNSAGNSADKHWQGRFSDADGDRWNDFLGTDETINIRVRGGDTLTVILNWDDWDSPSQDYDLCLFGYWEPDGLRLIGCTDNPQPGSDPVEGVGYRADRDMIVHVAIHKHSASGDANFQLFSSHPLDEHAVADSSLVIPADSPGSMSVGASHWGTGDLEWYSSRGPTVDGRVKPDISGPTRVSTTAYGAVGFAGTSAAAPHVAGAAALAMEKYPGATADQVQVLLESMVESRHSKSNRDGTGRVDVSVLATSDVLALDNARVECASSGMCYFPATLTVPRGATVTWTNVGTTPIGFQSYPSSGKIFSSGILLPGDSYSMAFDADGTFDYHGHPYPWTTGRIIVGTGEYLWPAISSAAVTGPNQVTVTFSKPVTAALDDFADITISGETSARKFTGIAGSGTGAITLEFAGPPAPPDAAGAMYVGAGILDGDGNAVAGPLTVQVADGQAPSLAAVSVTSSGAIPGYATAGDAVTLEFTASEGIAGVSVAINGSPSEPESAGGNSWSATKTVDGADPSGPVEFAIGFADAAGNSGPRATATTDGSSVSVSRADASIRGTVFSDPNGNGVRDAGDAGIPGHVMLAMYLSTGSAATVATDADGTYAFEDVLPTPHVTVVQTGLHPPGHVLSTASPYAYLSPRADGTETFDVGFRPVLPGEFVSLHVTAYRDDNSNGVRDAGEGPFPGLRVDVHTYSTNELETMTTGADGAASKADLVPADWLAQAALPAGYAATSPVDGATGVPGALLTEDPRPGSVHYMEIGMAPAP